MKDELITISTYKDIDSYLDQEDMKRMENTIMRYEEEIRKLKKDKDGLIEQLTMVKAFSDSLWDKLKANHLL